METVARWSVRVGLAVLAGLALIGASPQPSVYEAWIDRDDVAHIRFQNVAEGSPRRVYVRADAVPTCPVCPPGPAAEYVVEPPALSQKWHPARKWVEANFPVSAVGGLRAFYFVGTADTPSAGERVIGSGRLPGAE